MSKDDKFLSCSANKEQFITGGGGGIGYQVADTGLMGWVNFWPGCSLVPKY